MKVKEAPQSLPSLYVVYCAFSAFEYDSRLAFVCGGGVRPSPSACNDAAPPHSPPPAPACCASPPACALDGAGLSLKPFTKVRLKNAPWRSRVSSRSPPPPPPSPGLAPHSSPSWSGARRSSQSPAWSRLISRPCHTHAHKGHHQLQRHSREGGISGSCRAAMSAVRTQSAGAHRQARIQGTDAVRSAADQFCHSRSKLLSRRVSDVEARSLPHLVHKVQT